MDILTQGTVEQWLWWRQRWRRHGHDMEGRGRVSVRRGGDREVEVGFFGGGGGLYKAG